MGEILGSIRELGGLARIAVLAVAAHFAVRGIRSVADRLLAPAHTAGADAKRAVARRHPKVATITSATPRSSACGKPALAAGGTCG